MHTALCQHFFRFRVSIAVFAKVLAGIIRADVAGKIAGNQIIKLLTLGLTEAQAEEQIINGFLK